MCTLELWRADAPILIHARAVHPFITRAAVLTRFAGTKPQQTRMRTPYVMAPMCVWAWVRNTDWHGLAAFCHTYKQISQVDNITFVTWVALPVTRLVWSTAREEYR